MANLMSDHHFQLSGDNKVDKVLAISKLTSEQKQGYLFMSLSKQGPVIIKWVHFLTYLKGILRNRLVWIEQSTSLKHVHNIFYA